MKKSILALTVVAALALTGSAFARGGMGGPGMGPGAGFCGGPGGAATPEQTTQYKKFVADTLPLRDEMHAKRMEIKKEWIKEKPDNEKIAKLEGELRGLYQKMYDAREKSGIRMGGTGGRQGGCGMGQGMMGCGPCGQNAPQAAPAK